MAWQKSFSQTNPSCQKWNLKVNLANTREQVKKSQFASFCLPPTRNLDFHYKSGCAKMDLFHTSQKCYYIYSLKVTKINLKFWTIVVDILTLDKLRSEITNLPVKSYSTHTFGDMSLQSPQSKNNWFHSEKLE